VLAQPTDEAFHFAVAPHPGWKALERILHPGDWLPLPAVTIDSCRVRPVGFDRDNGKPVPLDQPPGDRSAGLVELGCAVAGLANEHHPGVGVALEGVGKVRVI
jgi:hypothetical protein